MNLLEFSALLGAVSMAVLATAAGIALAKGLPVIRRLEATLHEARLSLRRLRRVTRDLQHLSRDASRLERRISRTAHGVLDQVEPPLRLIGALMTGARSGFTAWTRGSRPHANGAAPARRHRPLERSAS